MKGGVMTRSKYEKAKRYFNNEIENANQRIYELQSKYEYLDMYVNGGAARGGLTSTKLKQMEAELEEIPGLIDGARADIRWAQRRLRELSMQSIVD